MNILRYAYVMLVAILTGCVTLEQAQEGVNKLSEVWQRDNDQIYKQAGVRYYNIAADKAHRAMLIALTNMGLTIEQQDSAGGFIFAKGTAPSPLSMDEWRQVVAAETDRAKDVSGLPRLTLDPSNRDVILNVIILRRQNDVQISVRARNKYTGSTRDVVTTTQGPPLAVKMALAKTFDAFEKVAFLQDAVLDKSQ